MTEEKTFEEVPPRPRRFFACPLCNDQTERIGEVGYTGLWLRHELAELWLMDGSTVVHKHFGLEIPSPERMCDGFLF